MTKSKSQNMGFLAGIKHSLLMKIKVKAVGKAKKLYHKDRQENPKHEVLSQHGTISESTVIPPITH